MVPTTRRGPDATLLCLAAIAGLGGLAAIGTSTHAPLSPRHGGHLDVFLFSSQAGAALAGAAANVAGGRAVVPGRKAA